ncbi:phosphoribosyltransferase [Polyangium mundeleinium]|uniref:Phosphoribosyltransferase family protein n=1 Tax=Polyangium mundeleinium TaxID=2995306 RepID=A0ABT5F1T4_9BACT|nr:phosphoribosyltransferase family protein [Polyangium mundeleinium]MDC0747393.1 phosphoribosyltransferase family protein [Polyangium mundeleinium]
MMWKDREEAGELLGQHIRGIGGLEGAVVLGIPRGGVVVAAPVAEALGGELGVIVARKLRAPHQPELAIGAVASDGSVWVEPRALRVLGVDPEYLEAERMYQSEEARRREALFGVHRPALAGRPVVVVDDGIATGATAMAALRAARAAGATTVVLAAPVASPERADMLRGEADLVVCLIEDPNLYAVGQYYEDFRAIEDDEVMSLLESHGKKPSTERRTSTRGMARRPSGA